MSREETLAYLEKHNIKEAIDEVVNAVMKDQPDDPFVVLAETVAAKSVGPKGILDIIAREIMDSKGKPTVEVEVRTDQDTFTACCACAPPLAIGKELVAGEAGVMRDEDPARFAGNGMKKVVEIINTQVLEVLLGMDPTDQKKIDAKLQQLQEKVGCNGNPAVNVTLPVSMAVCRAGAHHSNLPLYAHLAQLAGNQIDNTSIPVPIFSLVDGASNADSPNFLQEISVMPVGAESFSEAMNMGAQVQDYLKKLCDEKEMMLGTGDSGGLALQISDINEVLDLVVEAIEGSGLGGKLKLCVDIAAEDLRMLSTAEIDKIRPADAPKPEGDKEEEGAAAGGEEKEGIRYNLQTFSYENRTKMDKARAAVLVEKQKALDEANGVTNKGDEEGEEGEAEAEEPPPLAADIIAGMQSEVVEGEEGTAAVLSSDDLRDLIKELVYKYPIMSLEDPFARSDPEAFTQLKLDLDDHFAQRLKQQQEDDKAAAESGEAPATPAAPALAAPAEGAEGEEGGEGGEAAAAPPRVDRVECVGGDAECYIQIVGDAVLPTDDSIQAATDEYTCNTLLLDVTKRATISESVTVCTNAQNVGWGVVVGAQNGETTDAFIADLAVGLQAGQIKAGAPYHSEHQAKYNQLLRLASAEESPAYAGSQFRRPNKAD